MDRVRIILPCGFKIEYRHLENQPAFFECMICKNHMIKKEDCLEMKRNKFVLKQKEKEVKVENLEKLKDEINLAYKDPENVIKESFKSIKQALDLRREILKKEVDDYYFKIMKEIYEIEKKSLAESETRYQVFDIGSVKIEEGIDLNAKINSLDYFLKELNEKELFLKPKISNLKIGENYKLVVPNEHKTIEEIFGKIQNKLNEKEKCENINSIESSVVQFKMINSFFKANQKLKLFHGDKLIEVSICNEKIEIIDINTGMCIKEYFNEYIYSICIINKNHLAIWCKNGIVIRNINTGQFIKTLGFKDNKDKNFNIAYLKLLSDGRLVSLSDAQSCAENEIQKNIYHRRLDDVKSYLMKFWNLETGECLLDYHLKDSFGFFRIEESNGEIFYGSKNEIKKFNIKTKEISKFSSSHTGNVNCLKIINKELIASGSEDKTIKIWNMKTGMCIKTLIGHTVAVEFLEKLKNNLLLSSGKSDPNLRIWNIYFGVCVLILKSELDLRYNKNIFTDDYDLIVIACDKKIEFWRSVK